MVAGKSYAEHSIAAGRSRKLNAFHVLVVCFYPRQALLGLNTHLCSLPQHMPGLRPKLPWLLWGGLSAIFATLVMAMLQCYVYGGRISDSAHQGMCQLSGQQT